MVNFYDVDPLRLNHALAKELASVETIQPPQWSAFVKTGTQKTRPPVQDNWWHLRAAAVLIYVAKTGPIGVNKLRVKYGGKKRRGYKPSQFRKSGGSIIRRVMQQLETAKLIEQVDKDGNKGRIITKDGAKILAKASKGVSNE